MITNIFELNTRKYRICIYRKDAADFRYHRKCPNCNEFFDTNRVEKKYCSSDCQRDAANLRRAKSDLIKKLEEE